MIGWTKEVRTTLNKMTLWEHPYNYYVTYRHRQLPIVVTFDHPEESTANYFAKRKAKTSLKAYKQAVKHGVTPSDEFINEPCANRSMFKDESDFLETADVI